MYKIFFLFGATAILFSSCKKDEQEIQGCTDATATNYNAEATVNCCCTYNNTTPLTSDFTPPTGMDAAAPDLESPAYFRMMSATSPDGITWTKTGDLVTDQGNVPDMVRRDDTLFLYYTGWAVGSDTNTTVLAMSVDNGNSWVYKRIYLMGYGTGQLLVNGDPDVLINPDNSIRMFITTNHSGKKSVLCFDSYDGINFNFVDIAAHSSTDHIFDSNTFYFNNQWHMYAINATDFTHWYLTSTDGIHFNLSGTYDFLDGSNGHFASNGFINGSEYFMFTSFLPNQDLYSFTSTDGISWSFNSMVLDYGLSSEGSYLKDPAVVQLSDGSYLMVYVTRIP